MQEDTQCRRVPRCNHVLCELQGASSHVDVSTRKTCVTSLGKLVKLWGSDASFKQFAIDKVGIFCCIQGTVNGGVDIRDGGALGLLSEVSSHTACLAKSWISMLATEL